MFSSIRSTVLALGLLSSAAAQAQDLRIGALFPLTGPAAPIGIEEQQGVQFAVDRVNAAGGVAGHRIAILFEDSQGKPDVGVLSFNKLVDLQGVPVVLTAFSSISLAIAPLAARKKVLVLNAAAQSDQLAHASPYLLNTIPLVGDETDGLTKFMFGTQGRKTAAIVYENAAAGIDARNDFRASFEALGGKIVADESVEFGQTNYRPSLLKVVSAKPDFVYFAVTQGHATYIEQTAQIADFPVGAGTTLVNPSYGNAGSMGWFQSAIVSAIAPELEAEFKQTINPKGTSFYSREYFNATNVALTAMADVLKQGGTLSGQSLRETVLAQKSFTSSVTTITFDHGNTARRDIEIQQYTPAGRKVVLVEKAQ